MMSHSHQHPQPQQRRLLSLCLNQLHEHPPPESSFSPSQTLYKTKIPLCLIHSQTSTTPTSTHTSSFFGPKILSSSPHQHFYFHEPHSPSLRCCFNVPSRRWGAFKLGCTSMDPQVDFSSSLHSPSQIIVRLLIPLTNFLASSVVYSMVLNYNPDHSFVISLIV